MILGLAGPGSKCEEKLDLTLLYPTAGGYINHGIFLVREDCQSLSKGVDKVIVDRLPSSNLEWMAVVVIEEKARL